LLHPAPVVLFKVHHFSEKLPVREGRGGKSDCGGLHGKHTGRDRPTILNGFEAGIPEATASLLRLLMSGAEGEAIDVSTATLTEDGNDITTENVPNPFPRGSREVGAGEFAGVGNDHWMGGMLKKYGERFAGPETVRHEDVNPWNGRAHAVDSHKDMAVSGVGEASVKADLNGRASGPKGDWFGLFSGFRYHRNDGVKGAIIPPGAFIVGYGGAAAGAEGGGGMGVTEVEKCMFDFALLPDFSSQFVTRLEAGHDEVQSHDGDRIS
tara:strand:+ start:14802 stop:15599 length:798 start_codon:yes stop_codon:yes gene_type:complete